MRKEELMTLVVYGLMFLVALFVGLEIIAPAFIETGIGGVDQYAYAIVTIAVGFLFNVIVLELAHIFGALAGGYTIQMVNILGIALFNDGKAWRLGFRPYDGLTGETKVVAKTDKANPFPSLWFALLFFVIEIIILFPTAYLVFNEKEWGRYALIITISIGAILMVYNYMPVKLDSMTDGYKLALTNRQLAKGDPSFNELIRIEKAYAEGQHPGPIKMFEKVTGVTTQIMLYQIYDWLTTESYVKALDLLERILNERDKLPDLLVNRVFSLKLYAILLHQSPKEGSTYYFEQLTSKQKRFLANDLSMESLRAYLLVAGTIEDSYSECVFVMERKDKALKRTVEPGRQQAEKVLFDRALAIVKKRHKDWKL